MSQQSHVYFTLDGWQTFHLSYTDEFVDIGGVRHYRATPRSLAWCCQRYLAAREKNHPKLDRIGEALTGLLNAAGIAQETIKAEMSRGPASLPDTVATTSSSPDVARLERLSPRDRALAACNEWRDPGEDTHSVELRSYVVLSDGEGFFHAMEEDAFNAFVAEMERLRQFRASSSGGTKQKKAATTKTTRKQQRKVAAEATVSLFCDGSNNKDRQ